ncbi:MAG: AmmeMemoRadiSam system protein B, partial [bacterium]|nr:AmmeMemoRadiSam system protein B [bacterium]
VFLFILTAVYSQKPAKRDYLTTGNWYPKQEAQLKEMLEGFFSGTIKGRRAPGKILGIIAPHAGFAYSGQCSANAYIHLKDPAIAGHIRTVFVLGASHRYGFRGAAVSTFGVNGTPLGDIAVDTAITRKLAKEPLFTVNNEALQREHSIENHLPFLQYAFTNKKFKIVPILMGQLEKKDFKKIAGTIKKYMDDNTLVVASTDFTHYGRNFRYAPFKKEVKRNLTKLDKGMIDCILHTDFEKYYAYKRDTGITMCGFAPVGVLMHLFADDAITSILADYYKSGDRNNNYDLSVSYASIMICKGGKKKMTTSAKLSEKEQKVLLTIARETLEGFLEDGKMPAELKAKYAIGPILEQEAGVFVTLKKDGHLRGCIGSIIGVEPLYIGVSNNAVKSAVKDYRFPNVGKKELKHLDIEISVMTPLQKIDDYKKIRLGIDGVIIKKGRHQAVFLPQVATETGWSLDRFLGRLCEKAGLSSGSYKDGDMEFFIFQAQVFGEKEKR